MEENTQNPGKPKKSFLDWLAASRSAVVALIFLLVLIVGVDIYLLLGMRSRSASGFRTEKRAGFSLSAIPRSPRPKTLSPTLFTDKTALAYQIAQTDPELVENLPCYCGCYKTHHHQNNLDCYVDTHSAG